jgi:lipopolysaccharide transport system permease protein
MSATDKAAALSSEYAPQSIASAVSEKALLTIRPSTNRPSLNLQEVWQYHELLYFLIWRDIKLRYKQTALGAIWAIIQPLLPMLIFTLFFGRLAHLPSNGIPYSIFAYAGLLPWTYFSNAVANSSSSVVGNANLVTKVYFPRMLIPLSGVLAALVDFFIASGVLIAMMVWHRVPLCASQFWLPLILVGITVLAAGTGMLFAALNVRFRDIRFVLPFFVQFWMFATPVIYPASLVPAKWRWLLALNPMAGMVEGFRAAVFGTTLEWQMLAISTLAAVLLLIYSAYFFRRSERTFADVI